MLLDQIDFLVRFWELKARHAHQGEPLTGPEQMELLSLLQLVAEDLAIPPRGRARGGEVTGEQPVQLLGEGAMVLAELRSVSAGALVVSGSVAFDVGARLIVRITDAVLGLEYSLPCAVAWLLRGTPTRMALTLDGIPTRARLVSPLGANTFFPMGTRERMVG